VMLLRLLVLRKGPAIVRLHLVIHTCDMCTYVCACVCVHMDG
jgi:hypothetical protein